MEAPNALPAGHALKEYRIEKVLGVGGFGLTYLALDENLNRKVAVKEYLPVDIALRAPDRSIAPRSGETAEIFDSGKRRFLDESRTLASFRHPNIVRVMRFFEAHGTAYMGMEFVVKHRAFPEMNIAPDGFLASAFATWVVVSACDQMRESVSSRLKAWIDHGLLRLWGRHEGLQRADRLPLWAHDEDLERDSLLPLSRDLIEARDAQGRSRELRLRVA